jgi:hypothetical protein
MALVMTRDGANLALSEIHDAALRKLHTLAMLK